MPDIPQSTGAEKNRKRDGGRPEKWGGDFVSKNIE